MLGLPYSLKTILHEMRGLFIPIWLCLAKIDEVEMFVKARNFLILGLDRIGRKSIGEEHCKLDKKKMGNSRPVRSLFPGVSHDPAQPAAFAG